MMQVVKSPRLAPVELPAPVALPIFEVGSTYEYGHIGDSDLKVQIKVVKRTKCFVTFEHRGKQKRAKVHLIDGVERIFPSGQYSMAPVCRATKRV